MADPVNGSGTGPSDKDVKNAEELNKSYSEMQNALRGISSGLLSKIHDQIEDWDDVSKDIVKSIGKDLNREIQSSIKLTKILSDSEKGIGKSLTSQVKVQEQIKVVEERRRSIIIFKPFAFINSANIGIKTNNLIQQKPVSLFN